MILAKQRDLIIFSSCNLEFLLAQFAFQMREKLGTCHDLLLINWSRLVRSKGSATLRSLPNHSKLFHGIFPLYIY